MSLLSFGSLNRGKVVETFGTALHHSAVSDGGNDIADNMLDQDGLETRDVA